MTIRTGNCPTGIVRITTTLNRFELNYTSYTKTKKFIEYVVYLILFLQHYFNPYIIVLCKSSEARKYANPFFLETII